mgnify:CR=1 FL=1
MGILSLRTPIHAVTDAYWLVLGVMESLLQLIACLSPFLEWDELVQLPYKLTLCIPAAAAAQRRDIVRVICINLLPNTLGQS